MKPFVSDLFSRLAEKAGVTINIEPEWKYVGQIVTKSGKKKYFRNTCFDLNTLGATEIAVDKDYANYFMEKMGYPVTPGRAFYSDNWCKVINSKRNIDEAYKFALKINFPVFVKPNSKSQGRLVSKVRNKTEFYRAMRRIFNIDNIALVQTPLKGRDYRIVVLDNNIISAYERMPLSIVGDGKTNIKDLIIKKQKLFIKNGRDTIIDINDKRIKEKLSLIKLNFDSILKNKEKIYLLDNANLSTGGDSLDVTDIIHKDFKNISIKLTKDMGLRFCGVDLMIDGDISKSADRWWVIEINAAPGIDNYSASGDRQKKIVEKLYLEVLRSMGK